MEQNPAAQNPATPTNAPTETVDTTAKHHVYNLIILDESGSMESIKKATISGFNETLQTIQHAEREYTNQQHFVALIPFNACRPFEQFDLQTTATIIPLTEQTYKPDCGTPLYDAIGFCISKLSAAIAQQGGTYNVLVTVLTDGEENSSRNYSGPQLKTMIETLKPLGWVFTYMGANHDVEKAAGELSITHHAAFMASPTGMSASMSYDNSSRKKLYAKMESSRSKGEILTDAEADYFSDNDRKDA